MSVEIKISLIDPNSTHLEKLGEEARCQGYSFVDRLINEAASGENVFQKEGECFCGAFVDGLLVGFGGINRDPYVDQNVGRLRHVYVFEAYRRKGVAAALVRELLARSRSAFETVRLRTSDERADRFYDALGFIRIDCSTATHLIEP